MLGLRYLDGIADWGPRGPLRAGFGSSRWHDAWPQGLGSRRVATLQHRLPCREVWSLEAGCARGCCRSRLHLRLRICQRAHDGGGDGNRGKEVIRNLGKKQIAHLHCHGCCRQSTTPSSCRLPKLQPSRALSPQDIEITTAGNAGKQTHSSGCSCTLRSALGQ